jgi:hypothetical protein
MSARLKGDGPAELDVADVARRIVDRADKSIVFLLESADPEVFRFTAMVDGDLDRHAGDAGTRCARQSEKPFRRVARVAEGDFHVEVALRDRDHFILVGAIDRRVRAEHGC